MSFAASKMALMIGGTIICLIGIGLMDSNNGLIDLLGITVVLTGAYIINMGRERFYKK